MKILFTGGGTLGPVTPLLAILEVWKQKDDSASFVWVGTPQGPERAMIEEQNVPFYILPAARLPRYRSIEWVLLPFKMVWAIGKAAQILRKERPDVIASAGGYTAVPVIIAGYLMRIPSWVHQQDVSLLLTSRLTVPLAKWVTTAWEANRVALGGEKVKVVGNPVRSSVMSSSRARAIEMFGLNPEKPTVLVFGGGGGAKWLNDQMGRIGLELAEKANVIHLTGRGKLGVALTSLHEDYHARELLTEGMADALTVADVVVSRAGMGAISELSALKKASVIVPLPDSPQEENVRVLEGAGAAVVLRQGETDADELKKVVVELLGDQEKQKVLGGKMGEVMKTDCAGEIIEMLEE